MPLKYILSSVFFFAPILSQSSAISSLNFNTSRAASHEQLSANPSSELRSEVVQNSKNYIGIKYRWGGTTPKGFDCSGFVQYLYKKNGINIARSSQAQFSSLEKIKTPEPGDLLYFKRGNRIVHVGMYIGNGEMIHSPESGERIRIEKFDTPHWQRRFAGARRAVSQQPSHVLYAYAQKKPSHIVAHKKK